MSFLIDESTRPTVCEAMDKLWREHRTLDSATEFGTVVIIHMLLRRRWNTTQYPDGSVYPKINFGPRDLAPPQDRYLGEIPEYTKWRNYTCDCLDVLHWEALSVSARAGGLESPVYLHLHLARLVILVPIRELLDYLHVSVRPSSNYLLPHNLYQIPQPDGHGQQTLLTWAHQDQYKARLAVVHAGAIFWHVRRYSSDDFVEPFAVFLAALILWAFGYATKLQQGQRRMGTSDVTERQSPGSVADKNTSPACQIGPCDTISTSDIHGESPPTVSSSKHSLPPNTRRMPNLMQLDRPVDDELVQHFIRRGEGMRLHLEGVDDLCSATGPTQVLREAIGILSDQPHVWTISKSYAFYLEAIINGI